VGTKREPKLGSEKCGPEFGPDKGCEEEGSLKEVKRGRTALLLVKFTIISWTSALLSGTFWPVMVT
jgi:hypothetical protein